MNDTELKKQAEAIMPADYRPVTFEAHGHKFAVKRLFGHPKAVYHLRDVTINSRSRFGSREQIAADVASALETGALPGGDKGRW